MFAAGGRTIKNTHCGRLLLQLRHRHLPNKPDVTAACEALNGAALLGSEALMVRYATNTRADDMSDDDDDNNDVDDSEPLCTNDKRCISPRTPAHTVLG